MVKVEDVARVTYAQSGTGLKVVGRCSPSLLDSEMQYWRPPLTSLSFVRTFLLNMLWSLFSWNVYPKHSFCSRRDIGIYRLVNASKIMLVNFFQMCCITFPKLCLSVLSTAEGFAGSDVSTVTGWETFVQALGYFLKMFFGSAALGTLTGLISAVVSFFESFK